MTEIWIILLGTACIILTGVAVRIQSIRRQLATKLRKAEYDRRTLWADMVSARIDVMRDINQHGEVTNREAFGALIFCWNLGVYDKRTLDVSDVIAQAIVQHLAPKQNHLSHQPWHDIIFTIAKGKFSKAPWDKIEGFKDTLT